MVGVFLLSFMYLVKKMVKGIDFEYVGCIVEYGLGIGVFICELIRRWSVCIILFFIEYNWYFYEKVKE